MTASTVLVTGGAGYVGSVLVPALLAAGHRVRVLDLFLFGDQVLDAVGNHPELTCFKGDLRDGELVDRALAGCDAVIHLACISNDPSFELDPELGRAINYDAFVDLVAAARRRQVRRFVYASSSSVYGIKDEPEVTEDLPLAPLTDYSRYKAMCEEVLRAEQQRGFVTFIVRPATVCGYSPRLRLDLTVNILTNHAVNRGAITVFGGAQMRPNLHIDDMADLYVKSLEWPDELIAGKTYNVGYENYPVSEIAAMVRSVVGPEVTIATTPSDDLRSYHISAAKIRAELGFTPQRSVDRAIRDLVHAFRSGQVRDPMTDIRYYNIRLMQAVNLR